MNNTTTERRAHSTGPRHDPVLITELTQALRQYLRSGGTGYELAVELVDQLPWTHPLVEPLNVFIYKGEARWLTLALEQE